MSSNEMSAEEYWSLPDTPARRRDHFAAYHKWLVRKAQDVFLRADRKIARLDTELAVSEKIRSGAVNARLLRAVTY